VHTHLGVRVERYDARVSADVNHHAYAPQYARDLDESALLYQFTAHLTIFGVSVYPDARAGDVFEVTLYSPDVSPSHHLNATLKDAQARDDHGALRYRTYRGKSIPICAPPKGLGLIDKVRVEARWTAWIAVVPRFASDILALLGQRKDLFLSIHEARMGRDRWIRGLSLQTTNPAEQ